MIQVVYRSRAVQPFTADSLKSLLIRSRIRNAEVKVGGMLIYSQQTFLQLLEGAPGSVHSVMRRIAKDPRHDRVEVLYNNPDVVEAEFIDWSMGFADASIIAKVAKGSFNLSAIDLRFLTTDQTRQLLLKCRLELSAKGCAADYETTKCHPVLQAPMNRTPNA